MTRYRVSGYAAGDPRWVGPIEIEAADDAIQAILREPKRFPGLEEIQTTVYVETLENGRWVPND